ncbi:Pkinase-domain-containing protein [Teratosphaeria nubilosa]|uniref:non-specific serine/threonine protein kinase n=1 Tax=Teratosphaeria nubilosa TaxID=161662 RepID=A0A6G1LD26_9PEZI|nr:Pkinase-domain-containing protein [Teratosphaeria nubilosa]
MSAAAQTTALPRTPSTRHHAADRPHRTQSANARTGAAAASSPRRSASQSAHTRSASNQLSNVARHDFEQSNVARPTSSRQSESHDRPVAGSNPSRQENVRQQPSGHSRSHSRYNDEPVAAPQAEPARTTRPTNQLKRRTSIDAQTGKWELGKTIGAGSMGKVKLARNRETGEQVAVKIVPRQSTDGEHRTQAERERADHSKEVRTAREAAIVTLVDHPYICGMRDVVRTNYHWYMLFEYVNGGQMLDYIISHGRLKEKQARKFGRQIASALDYCHRNSIVHRDLKIENILISKNGDIKIIDFGLSNMFNPKSHLKTFCGSLYFAAPELLQARQYTGPEVDVWSFGIVLYVLVCGKVPFDDQSMPQLHAKIKRGNVEYPPWLSLECKSLIARMLNTNPQDRATLNEIMNHPWMNKGFSGPPENHLPLRKPLQLPLDPAVVDKMTGFDFGSGEVITEQLTRLIDGDDYQRAVRAMERRNTLQTPEFERKRGVFDFYKRRNSTTSRDTLNTPSSEAVALGNDPINAFHPLISVYYLAAEKIEREARESNPGGLAMPQEPGVNPLGIPDLPEAPQAAYTNAQTYEMPGEKPTGGRTRPRARTQGEDEAQEKMQNLNVNTAPSPVKPAIIEPAEQQLSQPARKESTATSLLRRLSTRRSKDPADRPTRGERPSHPPPSLAVYGPTDAPRKSFSVRRTRDRSSSRQRQPADTAPQGGLLSPPSTGAQATDTSSDEKPTKRSHGLGRSISVNSSDVRRRLTRRGVSEGSSTRPHLTSSSSHDHRPAADQGHSTRDASSDVESSRPQGSGLTNRTRSLGHNRKESMQARRAARQRDATRTSDVPEETDQDMHDETLDGANAGARSPAGFKPVYLKGFFSSSTTSSRPVEQIRSDLVRVLGQLGVEYTEIKGGFRCRHAPSIKAPITGIDEPAPSGSHATSSPQPESTNHRRKLSFRAAQNQPSTPGRSRRDASYLTNTEDEESEDDRHSANRGSDPRSRVAGETTTHVQSDLGESMVLKFEIFVVKVPLIGLHGIQFKKIDGGTWQYKNMAQTILNELRL